MLTSPKAAMKVTELKSVVRCWFLMGWLVVAGSQMAIAQETRDDEVAFFEAKIRPVLIEHCDACHSAQATQEGNLQGGLLVDHRDGLLSGGDSGPAVVPGKPDESLLLNALEYDDFEMPPDGQLPDAVIADFRKWIASGAADPRQGAALTRPAIDIEAGREHWAYQPIQVMPPPVIEGSHPDSRIDAWIGARLQAAGIEPVTQAEQRVLLRRLYYDLVGLPPTPSQMNRYLSREEPDAFQRELDRLLASPRFGERWARHWMDVVRYADSITLRGFLFREAWRYRDVIIDQFNVDSPYDDFVKQQIAGDLLPTETVEEARRNLVATTFLTLGNNNLEDQDKAKLRMDVVDEQLSTIGRAMLGQTIECARCHDHKFDPIPTRDYYALAGILRNTKTLEHDNVSRWLEDPLPLDEAKQEQLERFQDQVASLKQKIASMKSDGVLSGPLAADQLVGTIVDDEQATLVGEWVRSTHHQDYVELGYQHDGDQSKGEKTAIFELPIQADGHYEIRLAYTSGGNRAANVPVTVWSADGSERVLVNQQVPGEIQGRFVSLGQHHFTVNGDARVVVETNDTNGHVILDAVQILSEDQLAAEATSLGSTGEAETGPTRQQLEEQLAALEQRRPEVPKTMTVREEAEIVDSPVHVRGSVHNLGDVVPRGFLKVVPVAETPSVPDDQSGRRQLAQWMVAPSNPLTPRVYANRIWHWLFGRGIVSTTDNFGTTGQPPSHPELLDDLASRLQQSGWSTKRLIREIVTSETYRLSSETHPAQQAIDPENRLCWRANRRRIEAEYLVDSMLFNGGSLDLRYGGSVLRDDAKNDYDYVHQSRRRAVYWPVLRNSLPEMLVVFDLANPSMVIGRRDVSSTAPQSLLLMNNPWILQQSEDLANRWLARVDLTARERIDCITQAVLGRSATEQEMELMLAFLENNGGQELQPWTQLAQALYATLDFRFIH